VSALDQACSLIASLEGCRLRPYLDTRGVATIGYGNTYYEDGTPVTIQDPAITQDRAQALLELTVQRFYDSVCKLVQVDATDNQLAALTSFAYNEGRSALANSSLLAAFNNEDIQAAADGFLKWTRAGNDPQRLLARREKERQVFLGQA